MVEFVSEKLIYQGVEDVSNKPAERLICQDLLCSSGTRNFTFLYEVRKAKEFDYYSKINIPNNAKKSSVQFYKRFKYKDSENTLALKTFGPKQLAASVGKTEVKKPFFSLDKLNKFQLKLQVK